MKFTQIITPLATLSMVLAHGDKPKYTDSTPVSFSREGISNLVNVATKSPEGDAPKVITSVMDFFKRNPQVLKSIMTEAKKPEHAEAKNKAISMAMELYANSDGIDLHKTGLDVIKYAYDNPKFLNLIQKAGIQAMKDSPTLVDDFFAQAEKAAAEDPSLVTRVKDYLIDFSHDNEDAYKQGYELALKSAMINPAFSSHLLVHILQVDRIGCKGAVEGACDCKKPGEYSNGGAVEPVEKEFEEEDSVPGESIEPAENEIEEESPEVVENEEEASEPIEKEVEESQEPIEEESQEPIENDSQEPIEEESQEPIEPVEKEVEVDNSVPEEYTPSIEESEPVRNPKPAYPTKVAPGNYGGGSVSPKPNKYNVKKAPETVLDVPATAKPDKYKVTSPPANKPAY